MNKKRKPKFLLNILIITLILLGCSNNLLSQNIDTARSAKFENNFFTLDFRNAKVSLHQFREYFFTTFPHNDPTLGDVVYDRTNWVNKDLIKLVEGEGLFCYIKSRKDTSLFDSFRLTSKTFYNLKNDSDKILFIFKGKMPSEKGVWPAWWLNGSRQKDWIYENFQPINDSTIDEYSDKGEFYNTPSPVNCTDWPSAGEVDIIENINGEKFIHNTIHTCPQMCNSEWNDDGIIINCANAVKTDPNSGCSGKAYRIDTLAGTFACIWTKSSIWFYYWKPDVDVDFFGGPLSDSPKPELWSSDNLMNYVKLLKSDQECDEELHQEWQCKTCEGKNNCEFKNLKMIFNITLCGIWAGNNFDKTKNSLSNCKDYINGPGKDLINNQFIKIEYVAVKKL